MNTRRAEEIANVILNAPPGGTVSVIQELLGDTIGNRARDEHGRTDSKLVSMWVGALEMQVTIHRLGMAWATKTSFSGHDYNHGRAAGARGALTAIIAYLLTDL